MGEVVLAEHIGLGKRVVVKLLHPQFARDPSVGRRMQIEARSLAALTSPHIVQVIDFGQSAKGRTYIVMEWLIGRTLGAELKERRTLPCAEATGYVVEVLAGLHAAHALGIIHRDIKGDNIFLCDATKDTPRIIKILDFGVAKILSVATEVGRPAFPHLVTTEGNIVGTPRVVAPEQARGKPVDARTDVYAVGLLLYSLVVGHGPFAHIEDPIELLKANATVRPAPPLQVAAQRIPPALNAAILRALEKQPEDRFQSAEEFANELRAILARMSDLASPEHSAATLPAPLQEPVSSAAPATQAAESTMQLVGGTLALEGAPATPAPLPETAFPSSSDGSDALPTRSGWGTFVTLALLTAAISMIALASLYRIVGP